MTVRHFELTFTGSAQCLSLLTSGGASPVVNVSSVPVYAVDVQAHRSNGNIFNVGGSGVTLGYGIEIPKPVSSVPEAPYRIGDFGSGTLYLDDIYVIGTVGEKARINVYC